MTEPNDYDYYDGPENVAVAGPPVAAPRRNLSSHLPVRFDPSVLAAARGLAVNDGVSVSTWIRALVGREVKKRRPPETVAEVVMVYRPKELDEGPVTVATTGMRWLIQ